MFDHPKNINDLADGDILRQILLCASNDVLHENYGMDTYCQIMMLALVCRRWMQQLKQQLCQTAIVERQKMHPDATQAGQPAIYGVSSNIPFILRSQQSAATRRLMIIGIFSGSAFPLVDALDQLHFSSGTWSAMESLRFKSYIAPNKYLPSIVSTRHTSDYLLRNIPNIAEIADKESTVGGPQRFLISMLVSARLPKLRLLQLHQPQLGLDAPSCSPENITGLTLSAPVVLRHRMHLPRIMATQLQYLSIYLVDGSFPWTYFTDSSHGSIVFSYLERLRLEFAENEVPPVAVSSEGMILVFPRLRELDIQGALAVYTDFYSLFVASPVQSLVLHESVDRWDALDVRILKKVKALDLHLARGNGHLGDRDQSIFSMLALASPVLQDARLDIPRLCLLPGQQTNWPLLQCLHIVADCVELRAVEVLIIQLPRLWHLQIDCFTTECSYGMPLAELALLATHCRLQVIEIKTAAPIDEPGTEWLQRLAHVIPSLMDVQIRTKLPA
ncbi:hypothetical protein DL89DRAFT_163520 [Linderina pennispora]|uniref:F-box domain-containing protein n=1 Tax=Linderina pennispora TaxID=61395 RepID=A0A1Y1W8N4_9FUNG|nr:uncharacterized protein DL89DRAFT_163520 [Linderina pennispora]ORX69596.1 hypothetical protein DL89DRAFT_163520 [Linderina pennispora]